MAVTLQTGLLDEKQQSKSGKRFYLLAVSIVAVTALCLGYDAGVMSGAIGPIQDEFGLTSWQKGLTVGCINVLAAPGALLGGKLADWRGRVPATVITAVILAFGPILVATSNGFLMLFIGRMVTGVGVGLSFVIAPLYGAEIAPPSVRAMVISVTEILINCGILLGYLSGMLLEFHMFSGYGWRVVTGLAAAPALLTLCSATCLPESPRWLVQKERREDAEKVLQRLRADAEDVTSELSAIDDAINLQKQEAGWRALLCPSVVVRRMLFIGLGIAFFQQISGSEAIVYYTPTILNQLGLVSTHAQNVGAIMVGAAKLAGAIVGAYVLDHFGRKPAVISSCLGVAVSLAGLAYLQGEAHRSATLGLMLLCAYMLMFEIALAPSAFVLGTECYPVEIRAKALSMGMFTTRALSGLVSVVFPPLVEAVSLEDCLWGFFAFAVLGVFWAVLCVPETRGLSLEETTKLFERPICGCRREREDKVHSGLRVGA